MTSSSPPFTLVCCALLLLACGGAHSSSMAGLAMMPLTSKTEIAKEALVIEGEVVARVDDVEKVTSSIAARVRESEGRVIQEVVDGSSESRHGLLRLRLQPSQVTPLLEWLDEQADILSKKLSSTDVAKQLFDQELALENLHKTLARMQLLLDRPDLDIKSVLKIETEMHRLRGEIERIKGEARFLKDQVKMATIEIHLSPRTKLNTGPQTKFRLGARFAGLHLLDAGSDKRNRMGFGLVVHSPGDQISYEIDIFQKVSSEGRAVLATGGGAAYSDHLGAGRRRFLNPYVGIRTGYGYLDGSHFVTAGEVGLELFKNELVLIDVNARATAWFGSGGPDLSVVSAAELVMSF